MKQLLTETWLLINHSSIITSRNIKPDEGWHQWDVGYKLMWKEILKCEEWSRGGLDFNF